jgi:hypothetical protein
MFERFRFQPKIHSGFVSNIDQSVGVANEHGSRERRLACDALVIESSVMLPYLSLRKASEAAFPQLDLFHGSQNRNYCLSNQDTIHDREHVSEVDPVSPIYPLSFHRRIERQWAERIKSLRRTGDQVVFAAKRTLQSATNHDGSLIPVPVRTVLERLRRDQFS